MAFTRIRTINGKQYRYLEERWREGGKVRSRSISLGPADGGWLRRQMGQSFGVDWDAIAREELARMDAEDARHAALHAHQYLSYGLKLGPETPVEVEKPVAVIDLVAPEAAPEAQENAPPDGEAQAQ